MISRILRYLNINIESLLYITIRLFIILNKYYVLYNIADRAQIRNFLAFEQNLLGT